MSQVETPVTLDLERDGACRVRGAVCGGVESLEAELARLPTGLAGLRIFEHIALSQWLAENTVTSRIRQILGNGARPVRAVLFDKSDALNWGLGWHQDRTIAVLRRETVPEFGPWSSKQGLPHVEPPFRVMEHMITARIHIDRVDAENGPLLIACGSHRQGRIAASHVPAVVARCKVHLCQADRGDIWLYRTPVLHASPRASQSGRRRRVLQVDFSAQQLPAPLEWLGVS